MVTIAIEDIRNINVSTSNYGTEIDFENILHSTTRIELTRYDAELLRDKLSEALNKLNK